MKLRALSRSVGLVILLLWAGEEVRAQNTPFSSPALDSNCYFPQIGDPNQIDTIYGSVNNQMLGGFIIKNFGPNQGGGFGNLLLGNLDRADHEPSDAGSVSPTLFQVPTGPGFSLHNLSTKRVDLSPTDQVGTNPIFAHLRTSKTVDLFNGFQIFWADDQGNYDSTRATTLRAQLRGASQNGGLGAMNIVPPYIARLTSDTVDDIVVTVSTLVDFPSGLDTTFVALFRGGAILATKDTAYEDTSAIAYPLKVGRSASFHTAYQGDFRGVGREDLLVMDDSENTTYFKNDRPFSLERFAWAIGHDTIMSRWQQPPIFWDYNNEGLGNLCMRAMPKATGDSSVDFLLSVVSSLHPQDDSAILIFRGGPISARTESRWIALLT